MYIPPRTLMLIVFAYLLFLLTSEWTIHPDGAWYRPFIVCLSVITLAAWAYRKAPSDEL